MVVPESVPDVTHRKDPKPKYQNLPILRRPWRSVASRLAVEIAPAYPIRTFGGRGHRHEFADRRIC